MDSIEASESEEKDEWIWKSVFKKSLL